jgi:hypothetical protein
LQARTKIISIGIKVCREQSKGHKKRGGPKKTTPSGAEDQLNINQSGSEAPIPY